MESHDITNALSSLRLDADTTHKTDVGDFEMVDETDAIPSSKDMMREATFTLKSAKKIMNTAPIESALRQIISQTYIIDSEIPDDIKKTPYKDLTTKKIKLSSDLKKAIREQQIYIGAMLAACDEPMKKRSRFLSAFNPEDYKEAIKICEAFSPVLKQYSDVLFNMSSGQMHFLRDFYKIRNEMETLDHKLKKSGGKKTKRNQVKKSKSTRKRIKSTRKRIKSTRKKSKNTRKRNKRGGLEASERTQQIMRVTNVFKQDLNRKLITQKYYDCLIQNKVIHEFVDMNINRGWKSTPSELAKIIVTDNGDCEL